MVSHIGADLGNDADCVLSDYCDDGPVHGVISKSVNCRQRYENVPNSKNGNIVQKMSSGSS